MVTTHLARRIVRGTLGGGGGGSFIAGNETALSAVKVSELILLLDARKCLAWSIQ